MCHTCPHPSPWPPPALCPVCVLCVCGQVNNYQVSTVVTFLLLAVPYVPASFAAFVVRERQVHPCPAPAPTPSPYRLPTSRSTLSHPPTAVRPLLPRITHAGPSCDPSLSQVKAKHQQLVSGVSIPAYWLATFVWDNITYQVPISPYLHVI